jgi:CBS domain-containing protein
MLAKAQVPVLDSEDSAEDALNELIRGEIQRGLVLHDGELVGFLSISDLARVLSQRDSFRR